MALSNLNASLGNYWGIIQAGVADRLSTASLWIKIAAYETAQNITRPGNLFAWVTQARSLAVTQRTAAEVFQAADRGAAIDATMISQDYNARPYPQQNLAPIVRVRYEVNVITDEGPDTQWRTYVPAQGVLPATKGQLLDEIDGQILESTTQYDGITTGMTGNIGITAG